MNDINCGIKGCECKEKLCKKQKRMQQKWDMYWMTAFIRHPKMKYKLVVEGFLSRHPNHPVLKRHPNEQYYPWKDSVEDFISIKMFVIYEILKKTELEDLYQIMLDIHPDYDFSYTKPMNREDKNLIRNTKRKFQADHLARVGLENLCSKQRMGNKFVGRVGK